MTPTPPNPWGSCFDATAHNLLANMEQQGLVVCHGIGTANRPGEEGNKVAHAWLELDLDGKRVAVDCVWLEGYLASEYCKGLKAEYVVQYLPEEFMRLWTLHDFPGPWDEKIKALTKEGKAASDSN